MPRHSLFLFALGLSSPLLGAGLCSPMPGEPPNQAGDCRDGAATLSAELGLGFEAYAPVAEGAQTTLENGPQGGQHLWVAVKVQGFGAQPLDVEVRASDAFSGRTVAAGSRYETRFNQLSGEADGVCELHGIQLFLNSRVSRSAGLVDLVAVVSARDGRTATARQRLWLGQRMPVCIPVEGVAPTLAPRRVGSLEAPVDLIDDGEELVAIQFGPAVPRVELAAATTGLAASALSISAALIDPADGSELVPVARSSPDAWLDPPRVDDANPSLCVAQSTLSLMLPTELSGREALLKLSGDDGHGHAVDATRRIVLRTKGLNDP